METAIETQSGTSIDKFSISTRAVVLEKGGKIAVPIVQVKDSKPKPLSN